jgi:putative SbcD/Mre11-related phosphoesterase
MDSVEILPGFYAVGLCLHIPEHETLVFADTHLGYEEYLNKIGVLVPRFQYDDVVSHVRKAVEECSPIKIIINGDLKHEFGGISRQEWKEVLKFLDELGDYEVVLVKGNHDNIIGPITGKRNVEVVDQIKLGTTLLVHGHKTPDDNTLNGVKTIIIGHEHPCVGLREEGRVEKVKCFLVGRWQNKNLIVLPSLNFLTEGTNILQERLLSPFLQGDLGDYKAYGVEAGEIMDFGELDYVADRLL